MFERMTDFFTSFFANPGFLGIGLAVIVGAIWLTGYWPLTSLARHWLVTVWPGVGDGSST